MFRHCTHHSCNVSRVSTEDRGSSIIPSNGLLYLSVILSVVRNLPVNKCGDKFFRGDKVVVGENNSFAVLSI